VVLAAFDAGPRTSLAGACLLRGEPVEKAGRAEVDLVRLIGQVADCRYAYPAPLFERTEHVVHGPGLRARVPAEPGGLRRGEEVFEEDAPVIRVAEPVGRRRFLERNDETTTGCNAGGRRFESRRSRSPDKPCNRRAFVVQAARR
jgi:hypothetical protein